MKPAAALKAAIVNTMKAAEIHFDDDEFGLRRTRYLPPAPRAGHDGVGKAIENRLDERIRSISFAGNVSLAVSMKRQIVDDAVFEGVDAIFDGDWNAFLNEEDFRKQLARVGRCALFFAGG